MAGSLDLDIPVFGDNNNGGQQTPEVSVEEVVSQEELADFRRQMLELVGEIRRDQARVDELNVRLFLTDMLELAKDLERQRKKLASIATHQQYEEVERCLKVNGPMSAVYLMKDYMAKANRDARECEATNLHMENLMSRLQEKIKHKEEFDNEAH